MQDGGRFERGTRDFASNPATGAITSHPQTISPGEATPQPAAKVLAYTSLSDLLSNNQAWSSSCWCSIQVLWVTMVYGPIAAYLVEAISC
jgi:hypothetical protein